MQIEDDGASRKKGENWTQGAWGLGAGWSGRNEEKQLKYLQGVLQRCWFLMMFYCLFRRPDERLERDDDDDDFFN